MSRWSFRSVPWHPALLSATFILFNVGESGVHAASTGRAFLVAILAALGLQVVCTLAFRNRHKGSALALLIIAALLLWVPIATVAGAAQRLDALPLVALVIGGLGCIVIATRLLRGRQVADGELTSGLNVFVTILAVVVSIGLFASPLPLQLAEDILGGRQTRGGVNADAERLPDVLLVLMDGHPRADVLLEETGHDLMPFLGRLEEIGFSVAEEARSDYDWTGASLSSLFEMALLAEPPLGDADLPGAPPAQLLGARTAVNEAAAFDVLADTGYEVVAIGPPYESVTVRSADRFIGADYLNTFECHLLRSTAVGSAIWALAPAFFGDAQRDGVMTSLQVALEEATTDGGRPRFVFVHLPIPHPPVLWTADGDPVDDASGSDCAPSLARGMNDADLRNAYLESLEFSDDLVATFIEDVVAAAGDDTVVVLISDHGARFRIPEPERTDQRAWRNAFGVLFATRTLDGQDLYPEDTSLVNLLPRLFNAFLGTDLPLRPDLSYSPDGSVAPEP